MGYFIKIFVVVISLTLISCSEEQKESLGKFTGQIGGIFKLKEHLEDELKEGEVGVNLQNGIALTVSLVNTEFNDKLKEERIKKAEELKEQIIKFIKNDETLSSVKYLGITFVKHERKFLIVNYTNTIDYYQFNLEEQEQTSELKTMECS